MFEKIFNDAAGVLYAENFIGLDEVAEFASLCEDFLTIKGGDPERIVFEVVDNYFRNEDTRAKAKEALASKLAKEGIMIPPEAALSLAQVFDDDIVISRNALKAFLTLISRANKQLEVEYYEDINEEAINELLMLEFIEFKDDVLKVNIL